MADNHTPEERRRNMSHIRSKNTKPEETLRKALFSMGFRYRKNVNKLPGCPDIVLPKYKTIIFVNGCFWHMHESCKQGRLPKSNLDYWREKLEKNVANDKLHEQQLTEMGWKTITLWECELKKDFEGVMDNLVNSLLQTEKTVVGEMKNE